MKKFKTLLFSVLAVSFISLSSCEEFEDEPAAAVCNIDSATNSYLSAVNSFSSNPTRTNCNNLKSKANALITAASRCSGYVDVSAARNIINTIDCSDF